MKPAELKNAFGPIPEDCYEAMMTAAWRVSEKPKKRPKGRLVLAMALVFVLLAGVALAFDFFAKTLVVENDHVESMASVDGRLYLLRSRGLYRLAPGEGEEVLLAGDVYTAWGTGKGADAIHLLIPGEGTLYGLNVETMNLYKILLEEDKATKEKLASLSTLGDAYIKDRFIEGGRFICLAQDAIYAVDSASGETQTLNGEDLFALSPYKDGQWLALEKRRKEFALRTYLVTVDKQTGQRETLMEFEDAPSLSSIAYQPATGVVYAADRSRMYLWQPGSEARVVASFVQGDTGRLVLIGQDYAAISIDGNIVAIRAVNPALEYQQARLVVQDPYGRGEEYMEFLRQNGEVDLVFYKNPEHTNEEAFTKDVLSQSSQVDIYLLSDQNLIHTIKEKGYGADLSGSAVISAKVADMYAPFREAFTKDDGIYALPKEIFLPMLAYNVEAFETLGLTPPETYEEFFDFHITWALEYAEMYPDYRLMAMGDYGIDLETLMKRYANEMAHSGKSLQYQTPFMEDLLGKFFEAEALADTLENEGDVYLFYMRDVPSTAGYAYIPLKFEEDSTFAIELQKNDFQYFVVNPYSENKELATAFLEAYITHMESFYEVILFSSVSEPIPNPEYEETLGYMEEYLADMAATAALAEPSEKRELEERIASYEKQVTYYRENERFSIAAEDIATYRAYADNVYFNPFNPILYLVNEYPGDFAGPDENPQFNISQFLKNLDEKVSRIQREME